MPSFSITRRTHIEASQDRVRDFVEDFRKWSGWCPWEQDGVELERSFAGPKRGVGATYAWAGKGHARTGTMVMTGAGDDGVDIDLLFTFPCPVRQQVRVEVTPAGEGTDVVWTMSGRHNWVGEFVFRVSALERRMGKDFEDGLQRLKKLVEAA
ncbi:SRPBCC family protein [Granulicoccus sp. GXG6511]|uniref:SRPBCC family protein n=1 Tax=Granulicoccus sp. GXG6511 TaxID=3381351 RepID=UPI003D7CAF23